MECEVRKMTDDRRYKIVLYADDDQKRTKGLMHTDPLPEDHCALFVFNSQRDHVFWNHDVSYPLHLAFVDANRRVVAVRSMAAMCDEPCRSGSAETKYVVEATLGALEGVEPGDMLVVDPSTMTLRFAKLDGQRRSSCR